MDANTAKLQKQADELELQIRHRCQQLKEVWQLIADHEQRQKLAKESK